MYACQIHITLSSLPYLDLGKSCKEDLWDEDILCKHLYNKYNFQTLSHPLSICQWQLILQMLSDWQDTSFIEPIYLIYLLLYQCK